MLSVTPNIRGSRAIFCSHHPGIYLERGTDITDALVVLRKKELGDLGEGQRRGKGEPESNRMTARKYDHGLVQVYRSFVEAYPSHLGMFRP